MVVIQGTNLLDFVEVILRILIQDELANWSQREFLVGPNLGEIEHIVSPVLSLLGCHGLLIEGEQQKIEGKANAWLTT